MSETTGGGILPMERWPDFYRKTPYGVTKNGFIVDPNDKFHLIPDEEQIKWFEQGFDYLDAGSSLREVCDWISQKIKRSITHQTLNNLYKQFRKPYVGKTKKAKGKPLSKRSTELAVAKRAATHAAKKALELEKKNQERKLSKKLKAEDWDSPREPQVKIKAIFKDAPASVNVVFKPNPGPQTLFLQSSEEEILYGGAAGGEPKSWFYRLLS